jgi:hypothetical protein
MPEHRALRIVWSAAGALLLVVAAVYLYRTLLQLDLPHLFARIEDSHWLVVGACCVGYCAALIILVAAWKALADPRGLLSGRQALQIYGPAVLAKYLPGSVLQYASRQVIGARFGLEQRRLAWASLIEASLHPVAALIGALALIGLGTIGGVLVGLLGLALWRRVTATAIAAAGLQVCFFAVFGVLVAGLAVMVDSAANPSVLAGIFLIAWIAGFLVPIAPGGLGVREAALIALAGSFAGIEELALLGALTRLMTLAGDAGIGGLAYLSLARRANRQAPG